MVTTLIIAFLALLTLAVVYAPEIKAWLHGQERAVGTKLKADIKKVVPKGPGV